jgi:Ca2+-binding RTX toxin-like protein
MSTKLRHRLSWLQSPRHAVGGIDGRHGALSAALLDVAEPASAAFPGPNGRIAFASTDGSGSDTDPDWGRDPCTITGSNGSEVLNGTPGADLICGLGCDDRIRGFDGDDEIRGGGGNDIVYGGTGDDHVFGEDGDDIVNTKTRCRETTWPTAARAPPTPAGRTPETRR